jgi:hypothetical protein
LEPVGRRRIADKPVTGKGGIVRLQAFRGVFVLSTLLLLSGCYGSQAIRTHDVVKDIATSDKGIVLFEATTYSPDLLFGGDKDVLTKFDTRDAKQTVEDGTAHVRDTFSTYSLEPLAVPPGRYSFLGYMGLTGNSAVNVGGWTAIGRPLTAGFTIKAGEVIYLGHLKVALAGNSLGSPTAVLNLSIEDDRAKDDARIRKELASYPGAYERLQTRLLEIYTPNVPLKADR